MTKAQVALVLTKASAFDGREVGLAETEAWFEAIGDLDFAETMGAVTEHYRTSTARLMPVHVIPPDEAGIPPWERRAAKRDGFSVPPGGLGAGSGLPELDGGVHHE